MDESETCQSCVDLSCQYGKYRTRFEDHGADLDYRYGHRIHRQSAQEQRQNLGLSMCQSQSKA